MPRQAKKPKDFGEITLAIALLGGIIAVLLKITDFSNNQSLAFDPNLKVLVYGLIAFLLLELLIIFSFFIFKGIAAYADNTRKDIFEKIAEELFKISFIIAFSCFIGSILAVFLKLVYLPPIGFGFALLALIIIVMMVVIFSTEIKNLSKIKEIFKKSKKYVKIFIIISLFISIIFFFIFLFDILILGSISERKLNNP